MIDVCVCVFFFLGTPEGEGKDGAGGGGGNVGLGVILRARLPGGVEKIFFFLLSDAHELFLSCQTEAAVCSALWFGAYGDGFGARLW